MGACVKKRAGILAERELELSAKLLLREKQTI
jgi:hypothetical protein